MQGTVLRTAQAHSVCHDRHMRQTVLIVDDHPSFRASARAGPRVGRVRHPRGSGGRGFGARSRRPARPRHRPPRHPASRHDGIRRVRRAREAQWIDTRRDPRIESRRLRLRRSDRRLVRTRLRSQGRALGRGHRDTPGLSRFTLAIGIALLVVEASAAIALILTNDQAESTWTTLALALTAGTAFVVSGLIALMRRPENRTGVYLAAIGYVWFLSALGDSANEWLFTAGFIVGDLICVPFTALVLAYPTGRTRQARACAPDRGWTPADGARRAHAHVRPEPGSGSLRRVSWQRNRGVRAARSRSRFQRSCVGHRTRPDRSRHRHSRPSLEECHACASARPLARGRSGRRDTPVGRSDRGRRSDFGECRRSLQLVFFVAFSTVPLAFLFGILRTRLARSSVSEVVVALEAGTPLRDAMARALGDPSLELVYRLDSGRWIDPSGRAVPDPAESAGRKVSTVTRDGQPVAALVHDASLGRGTGAHRSDHGCSRPLSKQRAPSSGVAGSDRPGGDDHHDHSEPARERGHGRADPGSEPRHTEGEWVLGGGGCTGEVLLGRLHRRERARGDEGSLRGRCSRLRCG